MSWFDATGLASIAKTALKEAQKTIDKALDIKDDVSEAPFNTPVDTNSEDFFGSWGISQSGTIKPPKTENSDAIITRSPTKSTRMSSSLWGSFTGSFFDPPKEPAKPRGSIESLDDSMELGDEQFSGSKLVVQQSDDGDSVYSRLSSIEVDDVKLLETMAKLSDISEVGAQLVDVPLEVNVAETVQENQLGIKRRDHASNSYSNRLSVISSESGKNSSESVEILSGTSCTTSPESDIHSLGHSISNCSSIGLKQTSESVEVLPDSLTSPSSVEVLRTDSTCSFRHSQYTDEFLSPLQSSTEDEKISVGTEKTPSESVEIIIEDHDENSAADDSMSYASLSENTSTTVFEPTLVIRPQKLVKDMIKSENLSESIISDASVSPDKNYSLSEPITRGPSRSMLLPLTQINSQLIDTQPQSSKEDLLNLTENSNVIDIPQDNESLKSVSSETQIDDEGSHSDRTIIANDGAMESSSDTSTTTESNTNSLYLKNMIADAMTEKSTESLVEVGSKDLVPSMQDSTSKKVEQLKNMSITQLEMPPRETSPISSESRSDLVKIGSGQNSGHTSGDEVETTTSSDIEIISSPNGDSSSTHSRHSPAKILATKQKPGETHVDTLLGKMTFKTIKGHNRELSEASSISDDSHSSEIDRLIKRVSEVTEILELREAKLIDVNRRNADLQELNDDLQHQLDVVLTKQMESADLSQVTEEYTQRLSALERKFQQAIREKDGLRKQLEQSKLEAASRMSKGDLESLIAEKEDMIRELREEGEKLSKQQLQHSNIIKKLRAKEKEQEAMVKHLRDNVEDVSSETERLKRSLAAKEEVERTQIEAVHQLTAKNKKLEYEVSQLQSQVEDLTQKHETVKKSLDAAKKELIDKNRASTELQAREQMLQSLENEKRMTESQNEEIINQLEDFRFKLQNADQDYLRKEQTLRTENNELLRRLEDAEGRNEELTQSVMEISKPLVRQLEALQATHTLKLGSFEKVEQELHAKLSEAQSRLQIAVDAERLHREECINMRSKMSLLETQLNSDTHQNEMLKTQLEQQKAEAIIAEQELRKTIDDLQQKLVSAKTSLDNSRRELTTIEQQLCTERTMNDTEKRKNSLLQEQIRERNEPSASVSRHSPSITRNTSPTLSLGQLSLSESLGSAVWPPDDQLDFSPGPRYTNVFEMQMLQTSLKQREGEVHQLQWELNRREQERTLLNTEISNLLTRVEELETNLNDHAGVKVQFGELQQQYDTLCQLYGEKVEQAEELKLDLQDVKELYKAQLDELLKQQKGDG